jgi:hypothetical protein
MAEDEEQMKRTTQIYSIFGECDKVVAEMMAAEGKVRRIEPRMIPPTALFNKEGRRAFFAIIMSDEYFAEFEERVANMRM